MSSEDSQKQTGSCSAEYLPALVLKFVHCVHLNKVAQDVSHKIKNILGPTSLVLKCIEREIS